MAAVEGQGAQKIVRIVISEPGAAPADNTESVAPLLR